MTFLRTDDPPPRLAVRVLFAAVLAVAFASALVSVAAEMARPGKGDDT